MENFIVRNAKEVFEEEFLEFAGYNLQRRALPDARDGLKWGARKLLHAQMLGKLTYDKPFKKAIKSVSQAMSFSYTHGDASAYGTFIRMAKPFAYRVPLQEAKGNYGTLINPDDHSASRYVELRGSQAAAILLKDLEKETIAEWEDTYDLESQFPKVLPAKGFWNGVNGCISIGSGMACSMPPLNLKEVNEAMIRLLWNSDISDEEIICFPDFPTGGLILNKDEVFDSLKRGEGFACKVRASIEWNSTERCLIVKEMPYSTYTNTICKELAALIDENENCGITGFDDYTKTGPDLYIYLNKKANPTNVLKMLYKNTSLQNYFSINMTVLDKGITPKVMGQRELFMAHLDHEKEVYTRGFQYDLKKIESRLHILEGLLIALARIEEVIQTIKSSSSTAVANQKLQKEFLLSEAQAKAILDMKLSRLAHLEVEKLEKEKKELEVERDRIAKILENEDLLKAEIEKGLKAVIQKFGDARRTKILNIEKEEDEPIEVRVLSLSLTNQNNIFVNESSSLYTQKRGGVGNKFKLNPGECVLSNQTIENIDTILVFTNKGNFYHCPATSLPINEKIPLESVIGIKGYEKVCAITSFNKKVAKENIIFLTKKGLLKKSKLSEYNVKRNCAMKALDLEKDDEICSVLFTDNENIGMLTALGQFLIIPTADIRAIGRTAKGVKGIKLNETDFLISSKTIPTNTKELLSITSKGYIKRTPIEEFNVSTRYTKGGRLHKIKDEDDCLTDFLPISIEREALITASAAQIRIGLDEVPLLSKGATGNKSMKLAEDTQVIALSKI